MPEYKINISCETEGAEIRYTLDNSDPTESDTLYSGQITEDIITETTVKARAFKSGMTPSDVASKKIIPVPMALPDGTVLLYDRGDTFGEYRIGENGYPVRISSGEDDGSAGSLNWRYLICDQADLDNTGKQWGPYNTSEGLTDTTAVGYGLPNTEAMLAKYADNDTYWWKLIKEKRDNTGLDWFMPSKDELDMMYDNRTVITGQGGDAFKTNAYHWSSSEINSYNAWNQSFSSGGQFSFSKSYSGYCRLLRRI